MKLISFHLSAGWDVWPLNDIHETPNQQCRVRQRLSAQFSVSLPATLPPALVHVRSLLTFQFVMDRLMKQTKNEEHGQREWLKSVYQLCCVPRVGTHLWSLVKASKEITKSSCTADMADVHASSQENESKWNRQTTSIHVPWRLHPSMGRPDPQGTVYQLKPEVSTLVHE